MTLKLIQIPSLDRLCSVIENSREKVFLQQSDKMVVDLKQSSNVRNELQNILKQGCNIKLHVYDSKDYLNFVNYMVGTPYDESACI